MTMHDIGLQPKDEKSSLLELSGTVKTYRYLDESEMIEEAEGAQTAQTAAGGR